jgi:hypothetical protein
MGAGSQNFEFLNDIIQDSIQSQQFNHMNQSSILQALGLRRAGGPSTYHQNVRRRGKVMMAYRAPVAPALSLSTTDCCGLLLEPPPP